MPPVIILTDSSSYLPQELVDGNPIGVLPLTLVWDGRTYRDGVDIQASEFYQRMLNSKIFPSTSQISAGELHRAVNAHLVEGYDVLLLMISSGISGTYQTAKNEMANFPSGRVAVLDTKLVSMALGFQVLAAARAAADGATLPECLSVAQQAYQHIGLFFTVDTLKYLAAGGRINSARRLVGAALNIKPILEFRDGKIELVSSVSTRRRALNAMLDLVEKGIAGRTPVRISVIHALEEEAAQALLETTRKHFSPVECILAEVSPVIGAHVGPGTISIAYQAGE